MRKILAICFLGIIFSSCNIQNSGKHISKLLDENEFVFLPSRVTTPDVYKNAQTENLTASLYYFNLKKDTVNFYLPIGLKPGKEVNNTRQEYQSTKFDLRKTQQKNGSWDLNFIFNDNERAVDVKMNLWLNKTGYGTLTVTSSYEATKVFYGKIKTHDEESLAN